MQITCTYLSIKLKYPGLRFQKGKNFEETLRLCISKFQLRPADPPPPSPPPGYCGAFARLVSPDGGAFANFALPEGRAFAGQPRVFDTHAVSYQNITTQRILLEKQAHWLIC